MNPTSESARHASLDGLLANIPPTSGTYVDALRIVTAAKASGQSVSATALQLLEAGVAASTDEECRAAYTASPALQAEFPTMAGYVAYKRADRAGRIRMTNASIRHAQALPLDASGDESTWRARFAASADLQREYVTLDGYVATMRHEARRRR